ncbi:MAG: Hpt domain-containing protein [Acutalibacteraceae bacterium]
MHTIKSSSAMMGINGLSSLAHKLEDLFSYYRKIWTSWSIQNRTF